MKNNSYFIFILTILLSHLVCAQKTNLKGLIIDDTGTPLIGASIVEKGTTNGVTSDFDGNFTISVEGFESVLIISYVGYISKEVTVGSQTQITVQLRPDTALLGEVVVIGYGLQRKYDITTAVSSIKGDALANETTSNFVEALTGKLAGVQIRQTSGAPGSNINIRVRGASSISAGNNPLYVIDGVPLSNESSSLSAISQSRNNFQEQPFNPLASLNSDDIESIEVLKDASSAAIYGSRGSNGVVLITTKRGKSGPPQVSYNTRVSFGRILNKIDLLDAYGFAKLHVEAKNTAYLAKFPSGSINDDNATRIAIGKDGKNYQIPPELIPYLQDKQGLTNTDWQDEIFRNAVSHTHTLSIQGGSEKNRYFASLNYTNQEGIVIGSKLERFVGRLNLEGDITDKISYGIKLNPSRLNYSLVSSNGPIWNEGVVSSALAQAPIFPVKNADNSFNIGLLDWTFKKRGLSSEFVVNPVAVVNEVSDDQQTTRLISNGFLDYEFLPNLTYKILFGSELNEIRRDFYRPQNLETLFWLRFGPDAVSTSSSTTNWLLENTLNYQKSFGYHNLNLLGGYSAQHEDIKTTLATGSGFTNDLVRTINAANKTTSETKQEQWSLLSYLFRTQYNYNSRYFLSATIRRDGSSRFGSENKWGNFPSASVGWRISQEDFLVENKSINELKLRASYGQTGNFQIPNYGSIALIKQAKYVTGDNNEVSGLTQSTPANNELSWERTETIDIGLNASLFNNFLTLEADYYNSNTTDLLLDVNVPRVSGFISQLQNIGKVNNKGFELSLGLQKEFGNFSWKSSFNFATNTNEVIELGSEGDPILADGGRHSQEFITQIGKPIGSYYGYVVEGIYNTQSEIDSHLYKDSGKSQPGDFKFSDLKNDGKITVDDRKIIGDYQPDFTYGFTTSLTYKNIDFSFALQGVEGNEVLNTLRHYTAIPQGGMNKISDIANRWRSPENHGNGRIPRANFKTTGQNNNISTYHVEDGSYLKIQNITLGYKIPKDTVKKLGIHNFRIYATAQNPFLFTDYSGYNPEVSSNPTNQLGQGEDFGTYPLFKTYSLGLNINF